MKSRQSFPALKAALDDPAGEVGFAAAKALWDMGDKTGRGFIEDVVAGQQKATDGGVKGALRPRRPPALRSEGNGDHRRQVGIGRAARAV